MTNFVMKFPKKRNILGMGLLGCSMALSSIRVQDLSSYFGRPSGMEDDLACYFIVKY